MSSTSDGFIDEAVGRAITCSAGWGGCEPRPPEVGVALRGRVLLGTPSNALPASFVRLELLQGGHTVASGATDQDGRFALKARLQDGAYNLILSPGDFTGSTTVFVTSRTPEVVLFATRR